MRNVSEIRFFFGTLALGLFLFSGAVFAESQPDKKTETRRTIMKNIRERAKAVRKDPAYAPRMQGLTKAQQKETALGIAVTRTHQEMKNAAPNIKGAAGKIHRELTEELGGTRNKLAQREAKRLGIPTAEKQKASQQQRRGERRQSSGKTR